MNRLTLIAIVLILILISNAIFFIFIFTKKFKQFGMKIKDKKLQEKRIYQVHYGYYFDWLKKYWYIDIPLVAILSILLWFFHSFRFLILGIFGVLIGTFYLIANYKQYKILTSREYYRFFREAGYERKGKSLYYMFSLLSIILGVILIIGGISVTSDHRPPMIADPYEPCDNDRDGDCDWDDFELVTQAIGQCEYGENYNELADADHDGCVTKRDRQQLFPTIGECTIHYDEEGNRVSVSGPPAELGEGGGWVWCGSPVPEPIKYGVQTAGPAPEEEIEE